MRDNYTLTLISKVTDKLRTRCLMKYREKAEIEDELVKTDYKDDKRLELISKARYCNGYGDGLYDSFTFVEEYLNDLETVLNLVFDKQLNLCEISQALDSYYSQIKERDTNDIDENRCCKCESEYVYVYNVYSILHNLTFEETTTIIDIVKQLRPDRWKEDEEDKVFYGT